MNSEFKKIKDNNDTRYVLETATAGATSTGAGATVPGALGSVKKREDNILAQEKKETPKPRNFVAKNAKMGGAGQHKDKKKAAKQGDVKHKKPLAESYAEDLAKQVFDANPNIKDENAVLDAAWPIVVQDLGKKTAMSMFNYDEDFPSDLVSGYGWLQKGMAEGLGKDIKRLATGKDVKSRAGQEIAKSQDASMKGDTKTSKKHFDRFDKLDKLANKEQGVAEGFNGEYDDEAGMAQSNLITTARAVMGLLKTIKDRDNLPEWGQEKIAKAEMMLVSVWDYLQSQKEMGNDPQVAEGERTMSRAAKGNEKYGKDGMKALAKAGREGASEKKLDAIRDKHDNYNEDSDPCWDSHKMVGTKKKGGKTVPNCVPKESVEEGVEDRTSYQVAKILFDKGIKYDAAKENELINMIGMILVKELMMTPKQARYLISYDEDFVSDTLGELSNMESSVAEVAPKGWEGTVKAMKKHDKIDNPYALAHYMKNKGYKSHKKESADPYFESLVSKLDDLKKKK